MASTLVVDKIKGGTGGVDFRLGYRCWDCLISSRYLASVGWGFGLQ